MIILCKNAGYIVTNAVFKSLRRIQTATHYDVQGFNVYCSKRWLGGHSCIYGLVSQEDKGKEKREVRERQVARGRKEGRGERENKRGVFFGWGVVFESLRV